MKKNLLFVILIIILGGVIYSCSDETIIDEQTVVPASAQIVRTDVFEGIAPIDIDDTRRWRCLVTNG